MRFLKVNSENNDEITIEVSLPPWSESKKSYYLLIEKGESAGSWSRGVWFPKKVCVLSWGAGTLTLPRWLFDKLEIKEFVSIKKTDP